MSGVFGDRARNHLERLAELLDGVLVQSRDGLGIRLDLISEVLLGLVWRLRYDFDGTGAREESLVADHAFDCVDTIVDGALSVVQESVGGGSDHERGDSALVLLSAEDRDLLTGNLLDHDLVTATDLFRSRCSLLKNVMHSADPYIADQHGRSGGRGDSAQFELGHNLHNHDLVFIEEVHCDIGYASASHNDSDSGLGHSGDELAQG